MGISCGVRSVKVVRSRHPSQVLLGRWTYLIIASIVIAVRLVVQSPDPPAPEQLSFVLRVLLVAREELGHPGLSPVSRCTRCTCDAAVASVHAVFSCATRIGVVGELLVVVQVALVVHVEFAVLDVIAASPRSQHSLTA